MDHTDAKQSPATGDAIDWSRYAPALPHYVDPGTPYIVVSEPPMGSVIEAGRSASGEYRRYSNGMIWMRETNGRQTLWKLPIDAPTPATGDVIDRAAAPTRQMVTQWRRQRYVMPDDPTPSDKNNATMRHAQSLCVRCKLCGGSAVIEDAGTGYGYSIHCSGAEPYSSKPKCMCTGHRISGDAYNVMLMWNEIHAAPAQEAESLRAEVERLRTERDDAMALFHASDKAMRQVVAERDAALARVADAYTAGAMAVHREWLRAHAAGEGPVRGDPEFGEAAADYAALTPPQEATITTPHQRCVWIEIPCTGCGGTGWVNDEGWSWHESGSPERVPGDGLIRCGFCRGDGKVDSVAHCDACTCPVQAETALAQEPQ